MEPPTEDANSKEKTVEENELEMAETLARVEVDHSIALSRMALAPETSEDFDGVNCIDCGNEIPSARLAMKRIRCTVCQDHLERKSRLFGSVKR